MDKSLYQNAAEHGRRVGELSQVLVSRQNQGASRMQLMTQIRNELIGMNGYLEQARIAAAKIRKATQELISITNNGEMLISNQQQQLETEIQQCLRAIEEGITTESKSIEV